MEPLGAATGIYPKKTHQESPFPPSPKGEGRKSVQGFERSWAMVVAALTRPIPKFHQNPGHHCSVGSRGAAKLTVATAPMRNRAKQQGKKTFTSDRRLHLISREHTELPPNKTRQQEMCRWDLSPAILLLFHPAAISCRLGLQIPPCDSSMR